METFSNPNANPFGVQESMEIGTGDQNLINSIFADDGDDNFEDPKPKGADPVEQNKKEPAGKEQKKEEEEEPVILSGQEYIDSLLLNDEEEEEGDEEEEEEEELVKLDDKKKETDEESDAPKTKEEEVSEIFSSLSNDLFRIGAFTKDEDEDEIEIKTPEQFLERFNLEKKKGADALIDEFLSKFGTDYQDAFEAIYVKGVHPKEYFSAYTEIADYANLDMSKEDNQVMVVRRMLSDNQFDPEDIDSEIEKLRNYGDLESTAAKYHKVILKRDAASLKDKVAKAEQKQLEKLQQKQEYVQNVQTIIQEKVKVKEFDGIPLSPSTAKELNDFLTVDKYKNANGELLTEFDVALMKIRKPENHQMMVKLGLLLKTLEKDPTLSTIQKTGITKKTNELFSEVVQKVGKKSVSAQQQNKKGTPQKWFI